ncbi:hypothetical protein EVG20_g11000 [Dentipellis fragilis]|uniref:Protein kinase domain-containing protein n=1 Tax=Dentipellis fragilis TaxID=205917 RepID=A0A4Y9XMC9_9AGAM|nr:hypothetical protein EVG20_g11000 [Dentipellis fragilis]
MDTKYAVVSVEQWFSLAFRCFGDSPPILGNNFVQGVPQSVSLEGVESGMYKPICDAVNKMLVSQQMELADYGLRAVGNNPENKDNPQEPDLCLYRAADIDKYGKAHVHAGKSEQWGVLVSGPVNFLATPEPMLCFFFYLVVADQQCHWGYDSMVVLASSDDIQALQDYQQHLKTPDSQKQNSTPLYLQAVTDILENQMLYPIHKVSCNNVNPKMPPCICLIGKYTEASDSPTGRGMKGYAAYDLQGKRIVFLKDYWVAQAVGVHDELEVYEKLRLKNVEHVATAIAGGYVGEQFTCTQDYMDKPHNMTPTTRRHFRFITKKYCCKLETYQDQKELIQVVCDGLEGHRQAWELAGILHRDVSAGSIMINAEMGEGLITDWDLCKYKDELFQGATQHGHSGTWPFMSATLLQYPRKPYELCDDLESFLYMLTTMGLWFHLHQYSKTLQDANGTSIIYGPVDIG